MPLFAGILAKLRSMKRAGMALSSADYGRDD